MPAPELQQAIAMHHAGRLPEAEAIYRRLLATQSDDADVLNLLGALLHQTGRDEEGLSHLQRATSLRPDQAGIWNNLGEVARSMAHREEAIAAFSRAIQLQPTHAAAHANLGLALAESGKLEDAAASLRQAISLKPDYAKAHSNLGMVLQLQGRVPEALESAQTATKIFPRWPEGHNNLGNILRASHRLDEAITEYRAAIDLKPDYATAYHNLGEALARQGDVDAGIESLRQAIALRPDYLIAHQSLLFLLHYSDRYSQAQIFAEHLKWAAQFEAPLSGQIHPHANDRTPDRRLRIGYVSPDFRRHPVGYFMQPIFAHHDPQAVEVFVYSDIIRGDSATEFFRTHTHTWRETYALTDQQLADQIRADQIDILIDLTLHMAHSRLLAFARKPAPIQATYLGYAHTTGLAAMDYKISDAYLDPPGLSEAFHTEKIARLPETNFCCAPDPAAPQDLGDLPAKTNGYITFVSSNTLIKINAAIVETWCRILNEVENSRLLLIATALGNTATQDHVRSLFTAHGIAPERIEIADLAGVEAGFAALARGDIALDTFPYNGGTTTANALWMGLPVVTLAGQSPIARQGVSFLSNLKMRELIARSREEYIVLAKVLAADLDKLASLRATLRERMQASSIMDGPRFVRDLEDLYRRMWQTWCESTPSPLVGEGGGEG